MSIIKVDEIENLNGSIKPVKNIVAKVDTIIDLLQIDTSKLETGEQFYVLGYHTRNDGGGGIFYWDADEDKTNHNGGTIIDPTQTFPNDWSDTTQQETWFTASGTGNGCWKRVYDNTVSVKWFGVKGDGVTDDSLIIQKVLNNTSFNFVRFSRNHTYRLCYNQQRYNTYYNASVLIERSNLFVDLGNATFITDGGYYSAFASYGYSNIHFKNGSFKGNGSRKCTALKTDHSSGTDFEVEDVSWINVGQGIVIYDGAGNSYARIVESIDGDVITVDASVDANITTTDGSICSTNTAFLAIENCDNISFENIQMTDGDIGISTRESTNVNISNCNIHDFSDGLGDVGIYCLNVSQLVCSNCTSNNLGRGFRFSGNNITISNLSHDGGSKSTSIAVSFEGSRNINIDAIVARNSRVFDIYNIDTGTIQGVSVEGYDDRAVIARGCRSLVVNNISLKDCDGSDAFLIESVTSSSFSNISFYLGGGLKITKNTDYEEDPNYNNFSNIKAYSTSEAGQQVPYLIENYGGYNVFTNIEVDDSYYSTAPIKNAGKGNIYEGYLDANTTKDVYTNQLKKVFGVIKWDSGTTFVWDTAYPNSGIEDISLTWNDTEHRVECDLSSLDFTKPLLIKTLPFYPSSMCIGRSGTPSDCIVQWIDPSDGSIKTTPDSSFVCYIEILGR